MSNEQMDRRPSPQEFGSFEPPSTWGCWCIAIVSGGVGDTISRPVPWSDGRQVRRLDDQPPDIDPSRPRKGLSHARSPLREPRGWPAVFPWRGAGIIDGCSEVNLAIRGRRCWRALRRNRWRSLKSFPLPICVPRQSVLIRVIRSGPCAGALTVAGARWKARWE